MRYEIGSKLKISNLTDYNNIDDDDNNNNDIDSVPKEKCRDLYIYIEQIMFPSVIFYKNHTIF
jgi:hypothetical protein